MPTAKILTVAKSATHTFHKTLCSQITLLSGLGVEGDAHKRQTSLARSRKPKPTEPAANSPNSKRAF